MRDRHVLVLGVALEDAPSLVDAITREFSFSQEFRVCQRWHTLGQPRVPKFILMNAMLARIPQLDDYDHVVICDDDVALPAHFVDDYLRIVERCDFALAQPARTVTSEIHHPIVARRAGLTARETRFVEIGPVFSMRRDAVRRLTPFDETSPMGWGYDYAWPLQLGDLHMGIVDATPVEHTMRPAVSGYSGAGEQMRAYLDKTPHLSMQEAYTTLTEYR